MLKTAWLCVYVGGMTVLYLCPLVINSPCVVAITDLPPKPEVIGHRGAPAVSLFSPLFLQLHSHFVAYNFGPTHTRVHQIEPVISPVTKLDILHNSEILLILERCFKVCPGDKAKVKMLVLLAKVVFNDIYLPLEVNLFGRSVRSPYFKSAVIAFKYYFFL